MEQGSPPASISIAIPSLSPSASGSDDGNMNSNGNDEMINENGRLAPLPPLPPLPPLRSPLNRADRSQSPTARARQLLEALSQLEQSNRQNARGTAESGGEEGADDEEGAENPQNRNQGSQNDFGFLSRLENMLSLGTGIQIVARIIPIGTLLLIVFISYHFWGILFGTWCIILALNLDNHLKLQVSLQAERNRVAITNIFFILVSQILFTIVSFWEDLWRSLLFLPPGKVLDVWGTLWIVFSNDYFICFVGMLIKTLFLMIPTRFLNAKKLGNILSAIEVSAQLYRSLLPISIWSAYFEGIQAHSFVYFCVSTWYFLIKLSQCSSHFRLWASSIQVALNMSKPFGRVVTDLELGSECPICHDKIQDPIALDCKHIFCENCIAQWVERKKTCPICRKEIEGVRGVRMYRDGSSLKIPTLY